MASDSDACWQGYYRASGPTMWTLSLAGINSWGGIAQLRSISHRPHLSRISINSRHHCHTTASTSANRRHYHISSGSPLTALLSSLTYLNNSILFVVRVRVSIELTLMGKLWSGVLTETPPISNSQTLHKYCSKR